MKLRCEERPIWGAPLVLLWVCRLVVRNGIFSSDGVGGLIASPPLNSAGRHGAIGGRSLVRALLVRECKEPGRGSGEGMGSLRRGRHWLAARGAVARMVMAVLAGTAVGAPAWWHSGRSWGLLWGLAAEAVCFTVGCWVALWPADAERTRAQAMREEFRPVAEEIVVVALIVAGVTATLLLGRVGPGETRVTAAVLTLAVVLMQWFGLHAMYAARYAYEYYLDPDGRDPGGIDFNQDEAPAYRDFLYFSYNLGMTYQVSDTAVTSSRIRAVVLRHCLLSYLFALIILATAINVVTGVLTAGL